MRRVLLVAHEDNERQMIHWLKARKRDICARAGLRQKVRKTA